jgi:hypothetical protein
MTRRAGAGAAAWRAGRRRPPPRRRRRSPWAGPRVGTVGAAQGGDVGSGTRAAACGRVWWKGLLESEGGPAGHDTRRGTTAGLCVGRSSAAACLDPVLFFEAGDLFSVGTGGGGS